MVDTHAHLGLCERSGVELVDAAGRAGVRRILTVGLEERTNRDAIALAEQHEAVWAAVGRHPNEATGYDDRAAADLEALAAHPRVAAIGETGLDFYREGATAEDQRNAFRSQIMLARRLGKPLVIHMRDSDAETFELLAAEATGVTVVLHCFSASPARAVEAAARGWYCSFAGNVTYPSAKELREAAKSVPEHLLLVETDSPFLSPQPVRGRPNEPANVVATAERLAAERQVGVEDLERTLEENAARVFGW